MCLLIVLKELIRLQQYVLIFTRHTEGPSAAAKKYKNLLKEKASEIAKKLRTKKLRKYVIRKGEYDVEEDEKEGISRHTTYLPVWLLST